MFKSIICVFSFILYLLLFLVFAITKDTYFGILTIIIYLNYIVVTEIKNNL